MDKIAGLCKVISFRKKFKKSATQKLTSNPVGKSAAEVMEQEISDSIPEPERLLLEKEKACGLSSMAYLDYCYTMKRFTFNGNTLNDQVFQRMCPELGLEWEDVINEAEANPTFLNWRNKYIYENG